MKLCARQHEEEKDKREGGVDGSSDGRSLRLLLLCVCAVYAGRYSLADSRTKQRMVSLLDAVQSDLYRRAKEGEERILY